MLLFQSSNIECPEAEIYLIHSRTIYYVPSEPSIDFSLLLYFLFIVFAIWFSLLLFAIRIFKTENMWTFSLDSGRCLMKNYVLIACLMTVNMEHWTLNTDITFSSVFMWLWIKTLILTKYRISNRNTKTNKLIRNFCLTKKYPVSNNSNMNRIAVLYMKCTVVHCLIFSFDAFVWCLRLEAFKLFSAVWLVCSKGLDQMRCDIACYILFIKQNWTLIQIRWPKIKLNLSYLNQKKIKNYFFINSFG